MTIIATGRAAKISTQIMQATAKNNNYSILSSITLVRNFLFLQIFFGCYTATVISAEWHKTMKQD